MPEQNLELRCAELSARYPVGTPCRYWPGVREGPGRPSALRSCFWPVGGHTIVAKVNGYPGGIALTHLEFEDLDEAASHA